jgi:hypothetical protein
MTTRRAWSGSVACLLLVACSAPAPPPGPAALPDTAVAEPSQPAPAHEPDEADAAQPATPDSAALEPDTAERITDPARSVRICAGGDVLLGNNLDTLWAGRASARFGVPVAPFPDPHALLAPLRLLTDDADLVLLNIEGAIGEGPAPPKCRPGSTACYAFRQPVAAADALARFAQPARVVGNVANNHALDAGLDGYQATIGNLAQAGADVTGSDTLPVLVVTGEGRDTTAVLGFSTFRAGPNARDLSAVRRHVARAFARYRRVVVSVHMGAEGRGAQRTHDATESFFGEDRGNPVAFARAATEAGAALIIGHGPHVLRAAEWRGDALVFYSLGNLLTYGPFNQADPNDRGGIACATIDGVGRASQARFHPTYQIPPGIVDADHSARGALLVDSLSSLDFPSTGARITPDGRVERRTPNGQ